MDYHHFVLLKLTTLLECAGEEPIEDIDVPVGGRYEDDFYISLLMAMITMMAMTEMMAMMAMMAMKVMLAILAMLAMTAITAMMAMMAMVKTIVTTSKVNDRR